jgi:hypothetical protein
MSIDGSPATASWETSSAGGFGSDQKGSLHSMVTMKNASEL